MSIEDKFRYYGSIFKYPQCCITDAIKHLDVLNRADTLKYYRTSVLYGTGFIPCKKHRKIFRGMSLLEISTYLGRKHIPIQQGLKPRFVQKLEEEYNAKLHR